MPSAADKNPPASFDGVIYPIESQKIKGGIRHHVHEYPHNPGGAPEKLGRSLYKVTHVANFQDKFRKFPGLYPQALNTLRFAWESQKSAILSVPGLGTIQAFATNWDRDWTAKIRSGEKVTIEYLEDTSSAAVLEELTDPSPKSLDNRAAELARQLALVKADLFGKREQSLLQSIQSAVNNVRDTVSQIAAVRDQADMYSGFLEAKLLEVARLCNTISDSLRAPKYYPLIDAAHEIWSASLGRIADLDNKRVELSEWVVPTTMAVTQVSSAIFGDTTHTEDILALNPIEDTLAVRAGTTIRYYAA
jgi:prophage DNA circulation protein